VINLIGNGPNGFGRRVTSLVRVPDTVNTRPASLVNLLGAMLAESHATTTKIGPV
jgi:hypothetical protein